MKQIKLAFLTSSVLFLFASPAIAVDTTPAVTVSPKPTSEWREFRKEIKEERQELIKDIKDNRQLTKTQIQKDRSSAQLTLTQNKKDFRKKRIQAVYGEIREAMTSRYDYYLALKSKLSAKISEKESAGKNMTEAKAILSTFSDVSYKAALANFDAKYQELLNKFTSGETPVSLSALHESANRVRQELNILRKILTDTLRLIITAK